MTGALAGLRVVELATEISGLYAAKLFVDLRAEVTKIEAPAGDPLRHGFRFRAESATRSASDCSSTSTPESAAPPSIWPSRTI
ncbi:hypothetical protein A5675_13305 [Mycobacterium malmoense]|uniref:CoA transferase n=1 Tax=Mycobacterium malmoense TaxID=1780 RepID=UPI00080B9FF9|nr:CoA transferase [Mycobacterium malmoense]OCB39632.1 hypothetical protein A5675_13305 [Mycobacterium malmoense]